ncbi:MAG: hypothetical protein GY832_23120 [Chloroflexi bacterium]|nr:hypothetical protein [Chloroflexota bacterium]
MTNFAVAGRLRAFNEKRIFGVPFAAIFSSYRNTLLIIRALCRPAWIPFASLFLGTLQLAYTYCIELAYLRKILPLEDYLAMLKVNYYLKLPGHWLPRIFLYDVGFTSSDIHPFWFRLDLVVYIIASIMSWWLIIWLLWHGTSRLMIRPWKGGLQCSPENKEGYLRGEFSHWKRISAAGRVIKSIGVGIFRPVWAVFFALFLAILPLTYVRCIEMAYWVDALSPGNYQLALRFLPILDFCGRWLPRLFIGAGEPLFLTLKISPREFWQGLGIYVLANFFGWWLIVHFLTNVIAAPMRRLAERP